jgi:hypothetical protein
MSRGILGDRIEVTGFRLVCGGVLWMERNVGFCRLAVTELGFGAISSATLISRFWRSDFGFHEIKTRQFTNYKSATMTTGKYLH